MKFVKEYISNVKGTYLLQHRSVDTEDWQEEERLLKENFNGRGRETNQIWGVGEEKSHT